MYNKGWLLIAGEYWESGAFEWTIIIETRAFLQTVEELQQGPWNTKCELGQILCSRDLSRV